MSTLPSRTVPFAIVLTRAQSGLWRGQVEIRGVPPAYANAKGLGTTEELAEAFAKMEVLFLLLGLVQAGETLPPEVEALFASHGDKLVERGARLAELQRLIDWVGREHQPLPPAFEALFSRTVA
jgi:hypothetical protein